MNLSIPQSEINIFKNHRSSYESSTVRVPATCGELMQGYLDGQDFLINSPISRFARFKVDVLSSSKVAVKGKGNFGKVNRAVTKTLSLLGKSEKGASIEVLESIPRGKGLASSTAEMTAAISATSFVVSGTYWDEERFPRTLLEIDHSTDAVYCHGITMCDYLSGKVIKHFSKIPSLEFIVVDAGCQVETADFDREKAKANAIEHRERLQSALALMIYGLEQQIPTLIAKAATESALSIKVSLENKVCKSCSKEHVHGVPLGLTVLILVAF
ncbi:MAG: hypothetical protein AB8G05_08925 [Oligoflexales bacterium]